MTNPSPGFERMQQRLASARELAALLESVPMLAAGIAVMAEDEFEHVVRRARRILVEHAQRDGLLSAEEAMRA